MTELHTRQQGMALAEALVALVIVSLGLLALVQMQLHISHHSSVARDHARAAGSAQEVMERSRAAAQALADGRDEPQPDLARAWRSERHHRDTVLRVHTQWTDREGTSTQLQLRSVIAPQDTERAALLMSPLSEQQAVLGAEGGPLQLPESAQRLSPTSVWHRWHPPQQASDGGAWWVIDGRTGQVALRCVAAPANDPVLSDDSVCSKAAALFIHGTVTLAAGVELTSVALQLDGVGAALCMQQRIAAQVRFSCLAPVHDHDRSPRTAPVWSGRLQFGASASGVSVCRYAHNASSVSGQYTHVAHTLFHQNHVLSREGCPEGTLL
jgi:Tfp pilus assembly protein PilV